MNEEEVRREPPCEKLSSELASTNSSDVHDQFLPVLIMVMVFRW